MLLMKTYKSFAISIWQPRTTHISHCSFDEIYPLKSFVLTSKQRMDYKQCDQIKSRQMFIKAAQI